MQYHFIVGLQLIYVSISQLNCAIMSKITVMSLA